MITADGYSKDLNIIPEGIAVTLGIKMIEEKCGPGKSGLLIFLRWFEDCLKDENGTFFLKCKNRPSIEVDYIYVIVANRLYCRCYSGGHTRKEFTGYMRPSDPETTQTTWRGGLYLAGPIEKPRFKRSLRGFQGFRYTTKLF